MIASAVVRTALGGAVAVFSGIVHPAVKVAAITAAIKDNSLGFMNLLSDFVGHLSRSFRRST